MAILDEIPRGGRVLVIRLRSLGDCVLTTPALAVLRAARPDLRVGVVVEDRFRALFVGNPAVSEILDPSPWRVARFGANLCLNLHGGTRSLVLTAASLARHRAGFAHYRYGAVHNVRIPRAQQILGEERTVHTAEHLASAMFYLGAPRVEIPRASLYAEPERRSGDYAVIHPFASMPAKTWPADRFLAAADYIRDHLGLEPVFTGAASDDLSPFARHSLAAGRPLESTMRLLAGASLFLGNDSGPAHMAAAFGLPGAVLFGASDAAVWRPWRAPLELLAPRGGLAKLTVDAVAEALSRARISPGVKP